VRVLVRTVVLLVGLVGLQTAVDPGQQVITSPYHNDPRLAALEGFFQALDSPAADFAEEFLVAADHEGLDWRLLPSIAIVESGGGKEFSNNNIFGWDSCRQSFPSVRAGIHIVAARLARSTIYRNKDLAAKLAAYNPNAEYPLRVKWLMARLAVRLEQVGPG
jgi:hypothetical protein